MLSLVTKFQAKRLKEEGFKELVRHYYLSNDDNCYDTGQFKSNSNDEMAFVKDCYSAPTVSEALLWLEDNKGFQFLTEVITYEDKGKWQVFSLLSTPTNSFEKYSVIEGYNSRLFQSKQLSMALEILKSEKK